MNIAYQHVYDARIVQQNSTARIFCALPFGRSAPVWTFGIILIQERARTHAPANNHKHIDNRHQCFCLLRCCHPRLSSASTSSLCVSTRLRTSSNWHLGFVHDVESTLDAQHSALSMQNKTNRLTGLTLVIHPYCSLLGLGMGVCSTAHT